MAADVAHGVGAQGVVQRHRHHGVGVGRLRHQHPPRAVDGVDADRHVRREAVVQQPRAQLHARLAKLQQIQILPGGLRS